MSRGLIGGAIAALIALLTQGCTGRHYIAARAGSITPASAQQQQYDPEAIAGFAVGGFTDAGIGYEASMGFFGSEADVAGFAIESDYTLSRVSATYGVPKGKVRPYAIAGATVFDAQDSINGTAMPKQDPKVGMHAGGGVTFSPSSHVSIDVRVVDDILPPSDNVDNTLELSVGVSIDL